MKLSFAIKIFVLSIFDWPLKTGFTVFENSQPKHMLWLLHVLKDW